MTEEDTFNALIRTPAKEMWAILMSMPVDDYHAKINLTLRNHGWCDVKEFLAVAERENVRLDIV